MAMMFDDSSTFIAIGRCCVSRVKSGWAPYTHEAALIWQLGKLLSIRTEAPGHTRDDHALKGS